MRFHTQGNMHLGEEVVGPKQKLSLDIQWVPREDPLFQSLVEGIWIRRVHLEVFMLLPLAVSHSPEHLPCPGSGL